MKILVEETRMKELLVMLLIENPSIPASFDMISSKLLLFTFIKFKNFFEEVDSGVSSLPIVPDFFPIIIL